MAAPETFAPLRELLPDNIEGAGELASVPGLAELLDGLYYSAAWVDSTPTESRYAVVLGVFDGFAIQLPWLPGLELRIGSTAAEPVAIEVSCSITEGWNLSARGIPLQITFPPEILARADDPNRGSTVTITADVTIDDGLNCDVEISDSIDLPLSLIGGTTLGIELQGLSFDLGAAAERRGISARLAKLRLPEDLLDAPLDITFENFFVGEGGLSGRASWAVPEGLDAPVWDEQQHMFSGIGTGNLFGSLPTSLRQVSVELVDSIPRQGTIVAYAFVPYFEQVIAVEASLGSGSVEFVLAAAPAAQPVGTPVSATGLVSLRREDVLAVALNALSIAVRDGKITIGLSGSVTPLFGGVDWPTFELEGLTIDSTGKVTISGGWINLGKAGTIEVNGATIEITKFGIGSEADGTKWIGFSGGLKLAEPIPVSGSVEGFKVLWRGSDVWAQLRGVAVGFEIPDSVIFSGHLEFFEDPEEPRGNVPGKQRGFRGGGSLTILPTNMKISSEVVLGRCDGPPPYAFAYLFVDFQSPVGIPLPLPNIAAYGFAGMFGLAMEPARNSNQHWWYDWYLLPEPGVSSSVKWRPARGALAFGVGVTLGTASDDGYAVNAKLLLVLVLPGPIIMLEGVAGFLTDRTLLGPDSPIHALAILDGRAGQFLMNVSARYPFDEADEMNKLIKARGTAEAYFDGSGDWHLYLGERDPQSKRIAAEILDLFEARAYTMLMPDQLAFGVWIGYVKHWKKGPLKVDLEAWMDANVRISWRPVQLAGDLTMVGDLGLRAFGIGASLNVRAAVAAQAPRPYQFHAEIEAKLRTPRFIPDPKFRFEWDYKEEATPAILNPIGKLGVEHLKVSEKWTLEGADSEANAPTVPLDGKVAISFQRSVADLPLVGGSSISGIPAWERAGKFEFRYRLTEVRLERRPKGSAGGAWETVATRSESQSDETKLWGVWLAADTSSASSESSPNAPMTKLLLHAKSPFEYARENADDSWYEHFADWHPDFGWIRVTPPHAICHDFADMYKGRAERHEFIARGEVIIMAANLMIDRVSADRPVHLDLAAHNVVAWILFPEPVSLVQLHFASAKGRVVTYDGENQLTVVDLSLDPSGISTIGALDGPTFTSLAVYSSTGLLIKLCYVTASEAGRYQEDTEDAASAVASSDHYDDPPGADLLLPQSYYRVTITADGQRRRRGESEVDENTFQRVAYFQTADPPGVFDQPNEGALATEAGAPQYPSAGPLRDLGAYIAVRDEVAQTPDLPSGADASRATTPLNGALVAYRGYDVGVTFNENYVEQMYLMAGMPLVLSLYDNNGQPVGSARVAAADVVPALSSSWQLADADANSSNRAVEQHTASRQRAAAQLVESEAAIGPVGTPLTVDRSIVYSAGLLNGAAVTPPQAIWVGGPDFVLQPRALYRAALEPVRPAAVVHLDQAGAPLRAADNTYLIDRVASDGSNLAQVLEDTVGQAEAGPKLLSDGRSVILHVDHDMPVTDRPVVDLRLMQRILEEFSGWSASLGPPPQVYRWNFVTSAFVTFAHHMHSFVGAAWDRRRASAVPWTPLDATVRAELRGLIETNPVNEPALYARAAAIFGVGPAALPAVVEIHLLEDTNGRYGFLLESPEPLDWRRASAGRVTLALRSAAQALPAPSSAPSRVRIVFCDIANELIEVLVMDDVDLTAFSVERVTGANSTESAERIHQFVNGTSYLAGTLVRLAIRNSPGITMGPDAVEIGLGAQTRLLGNQVETIRILDPSGREVHRCTFLPLGDYTGQNVVTATDPDGTRGFIFVRAAGGTWDANVPDATYQLVFQYRRNAGARRPVLRRGGSTASENVVLSFGVPAALP